MQFGRKLMVHITRNEQSFQLNKFGVLPSLGQMLNLVSTVLQDTVHAY